MYMRIGNCMYVCMYGDLLLGHVGGLCLWITCNFIVCICWCV